MQKAAETSTSPLATGTAFSELTNAIGASLHFHTNCDAFLERLAATHNLSHCVVVLRSSEWPLVLRPREPAATDDTSYLIAHVFPASPATTFASLADKDLVQRILDARSMSAQAADLGLQSADLATPDTATVHLSALGRFGVVAGVEAGPAAQPLYPPAPLFSLFARSVANCLDHETELLVTEQQTRLEQQWTIAQRLDSLTTTAGNILHELNNLLTPLLNYPDLIRKRQHLGEPIEEDLAAVEQAATRAADLNAQLEALINGADHPEPQSVWLNDCVRVLCNSAWCEQLRQTYPEVTLSFTGDAPASVSIDPERLFLVLLAFIGDAFEAQTGAGTVHIDIQQHELTAQRLSSGSIPAGHYFSVQVTDSRADALEGHLDATMETLELDEIGGYAHVVSTPGDTRRTLYFPSN